MTPLLPAGYSVRPATLADIPQAVDLFNAFTQHYLGTNRFKISDLETEWTFPKFDPEEDIRLVFGPEGQLVGYIEVWTTDNPPVHPWVWGRVHPDHEGKGIGTYLMTWADARASTAIPHCPAGARVAYRTGTLSNIAAPQELLNKMGLQTIRHYFRMLIEMDTPPSKPICPDGIRVRTVDDPAAEIETLYQVDRQAFKDHFGYVEHPFEDGLAEFRHWFLNNENNSDGSLWFLAMDGDQVAGMALCLQDDNENTDWGHVDILAVLRPWRKRGIGLALLQQAFGEYYRRGKSGVTLGVDAQNLTGALRLYEKAGMRIQRRFDMYEKELRPGEDLSVKSLAE